MSKNNLDKREAILRATLDLVAEHGFHNTPVSLIVKQSGVSTGIVYHYFGSKDEVIKALYKDIKTAFGQAVVANLDFSADWRECLRQIWLNTFHFYVAHPKETFFLEQYDNSPYAAVQPMEMSREWMQLGEFIHREIARGNLKPLPYEALYALSLGVALTLAKYQIMRRLQLTDVQLWEIAESCLRAASQE